MTPSVPRRFTVEEYHRLTETGVLTEDDDLELLEGYLVQKPSRSPAHCATLTEVLNLLIRHLPGGWKFRCQMALTLDGSEPEPDLAVVRESSDRYRTRHPLGAEAGLVVEVADSTLDGDRVDKARIYARAAIPVYWIVNIPDNQVEVYDGPSGPAAKPGYGRRRDFALADGVPLILDGNLVATLAVRDLLG